MYALNGKGNRMKQDSTPARAPVARVADPAVRALVLQAQAGSRDAYLALQAKYRPLLLASLARFGDEELSRQEREDLREEAERVFLGAVSTYDTEQEAVDFGLYAKICLRNGLISEWRHMEARRRHEMLPLPEEALSGGHERTDPASLLVEEERFRQLCAAVRGYLSPFENRVWWQYVTGISVPDIANALNCEERSVHNAIYRIRRKLRAHIRPPEA